MPLCKFLASSVPRVRLRLASREAMLSRLASCMGGASRSSCRRRRSVLLSRYARRFSSLASR
jgi:hypothetical protein